MRALLIALMLFYASLVSIVAVAEDVCANCTPEQFAKRYFDCKKNFPVKQLPKRLIVDKASKLVMVCDYKVTPRDDGGEDLQGGFWFKTNKICSGTVGYELSDAGELNFYPDSKSCSIGGELQSRKNAENYSLDDRSKLKVPVKPPYSCLIAKAKIRVKTYTYGFDDFDQGESFSITEYDVLKVGAYRKCKSQESGFGKVFEMKNGKWLLIQ